MSSMEYEIYGSFLVKGCEYKFVLYDSCITGTFDKMLVNTTTGYTTILFTEKGQTYITSMPYSWIESVDCLNDYFLK